MIAPPFDVEEHELHVCFAADPTRPAVLLFHGWSETGSVWTNPSTTEHAFDHRHAPDGKRIGDTHEVPNATIYKVGNSEWLYDDYEGGKEQWDQDHSWFDFLRRKDFTVATWTQLPLVWSPLFNMPVRDEDTFANAYLSAVQVFDWFAEETAARSPDAPPPIVLVGHSRGGLVIRQLLKDKWAATLDGDGAAAAQLARVSDVVTLMSPHYGSEVARLPAEAGAELVAELMDYYEGWFHDFLVALFDLKDEDAEIREWLEDLVTELLRPINKLFIDRAGRELVVDGPLVRHVAEGEVPIEGVHYLTFAGTSPRFTRLYVWLFDAMSAVPQCSLDEGQYFVWRVEPVEIDIISPLLDIVRNIVPEWTPGHGDAAVSKESAQLPEHFGATHVNVDLNHWEGLWDEGIQGRIGRMLETAADAVKRAPSIVVATPTPILGGRTVIVPPTVAPARTVQLPDRVPGPIIRIPTATSIIGHVPAIVPPSATSIIVHAPVIVPPTPTPIVHAPVIVPPTATTPRLNIGPIRP